MTLIPKKRRSSAKKVRRSTETTRAADVIRALKERHKDEIFISEISTGSHLFEHSPPGSRLDAWAMKTSWSKPHYFGYEVKVTRADFMGDDKWPAYVPATTHFSFACPEGLISAVELPKDIGLVWLSVDGQLTTKRRPKYRPVTEANRPVIANMIKAALMRNKSMTGDVEERNRYWREWLASKAENRELEGLVSREVAATISARESSLARREAATRARENRIADRDREAEKIRAILCDLTGLSRLEQYGTDEAVKERLRRLIESREEALRKSGKITALKAEVRRFKTMAEQAALTLSTTMAELDAWEDEK